MPSLYECFSIAALESITSGLPVILTDVIGLRDWKRFEMKSIFFIDPIAKEFADKLYSVLKAPNLPTEKELEKKYEFLSVLNVVLRNI